MSIVLLNPQAPQSPDLVALGPVGFALYVKGLCHASRHRTGGFLPREFTHSESRHAVEQIERRGLWLRVADGHRIAGRAREDGKYVAELNGRSFAIFRGVETPRSEAHYESRLRRRTREKEAPGVATGTQIAARMDYWGNRCWMCGGPFQHVDHVIPLSKGGTNWPANLRPACAPCNISKGAKILHA